MLNGCFNLHAVPFGELKGLLTDIGVEELGHLEMIGAIVHQLTRNLTDSQIQDCLISDCSNILYSIIALHQILIFLTVRPIGIYLSASINIALHGEPSTPDKFSGAAFNK